MAVTGGIFNITFTTPTPTPADLIDLYERVRIGSKVLILSIAWATLKQYGHAYLEESQGTPAATPFGSFSYLKLKMFRPPGPLARCNFDNGAQRLLLGLAPSHNASAHSNTVGPSSTALLDPQPLMSNDIQANINDTLHGRVSLGLNVICDGCSSESHKKCTDHLQ